ncbi:SMP-30/gluconolactonase/LRE family protein [Mucilaginibacter aquaedulcis]|uniref:SMP-30/gluconolactonase/LRE family protein n=1 Tax=Mucilaginibacter aquaedulcis TaxID=1187081 RepID=UPI0025B33D0F|nr:SMP-30/gluconolactonase/LRE family protein [Mucilaginibacter aquaedulcis]MDN3547658.1 SMP-30/gluconolactonase/LRE family protein [Mucilaginibacter aquaedulcis]
MVEVVLADHVCMLGEGPVWDAERHAICWIDILKGEIHEFNVNNASLKTISSNQLIGSIAICEDGHFLAALKNGLGTIKRDTGEINIFSSPEAHLTENRFNDGKCDPAGRFWVGTMSHLEKPDAGSVYVLDIDGSVDKKITNTTISNGMAWSPDEQTFYFIDTPTSQVMAYQYDKESGEINSPEPVITILQEDGYPDGMTIDEDGMLWIAHWNGWQISRWNPKTGEKLLKLPLPVANVTSCTFGGDDLNDLYITTARKDIPEAELLNQPLAGALFVWKNCGYKGMPLVKFRTTLQ